MEGEKVSKMKNASRKVNSNRKINKKLILASRKK